VDADLDTLATALYVKTDDLLKTFPQWVPARPRVGFATKICVTSRSGSTRPSPGLAARL